MNLTEADNGRSIAVSSGTVLTIRLPENPTTGYRWSLPEPDAGLQLIADTNEAVGEAVGAASVRVLKFRANQAGTYQLQVRNRQEWEPNLPPVERFDLTITVR